MTFRCKKLLEVMREAPVCMICGKSNDGTICACHNNEVRRGKGTGIKTSDALTVAGCFTCHTRLDNGKDLSKEERKAMWNDAYVSTMQWLIESGRMVLV